MKALEFEKTIILDGWSLWRTKHDKDNKLLWNIYQKDGYSLFIDVEGNMFLYDDYEPGTEFKAASLKERDCTKFLSTVRFYINKRKKASH